MYCFFLNKIIIFVFKDSWNYNITATCHTILYNNLFYIKYITFVFSKLLLTKMELSVMSEYHKMDTNKYPNKFGCRIMYRTNIGIYLDATYLPNKYLNIFLRRK